MCFSAIKIDIKNYSKYITKYIFYGLYYFMGFIYIKSINKESKGVVKSENCLLVYVFELEINIISELSYVLNSLINKTVEKQVDILSGRKSINLRCKTIVFSNKQ